MFGHHAMTIGHRYALRMQFIYHFRTRRRHIFTRHQLSQSSSTIRNFPPLLLCHRWNEQWVKHAGSRNTCVICHRVELADGSPPRESGWWKCAYLGEPLLHCAISPQLPPTVPATADTPSRSAASTQLFRARHFQRRLVGSGCVQGVDFTFAASTGRD